MIHKFVGSSGDVLVKVMPAQCGPWCRGSKRKVAQMTLAPPHNSFLWGGGKKYKEAEEQINHLLQAGASRDEANGRAAGILRLKFLLAQQIKLGKNSLVVCTRRRQLYTSLATFYKRLTSVLLKIARRQISPRYFCF
eukprot:GHVT01053916.1.p1 GENE.GHVT01053916.1~~GHVT01053916.1.p1  ORF type:complete len:137 (+),score=10.23 GHVT01053916.1:796-1206(+)